MKMILILSFTFLMGTAFAKEDGKKLSAEQLAKIKQKSISNLDKRIAALTKTKSCIQNAKDGKALRACRQQQRKQMQSLRESRQEAKKNRKTQRQERKASKNKSN